MLEKDLIGTRSPPAVSLTCITLETCMQKRCRFRTVRGCVAGAIPDSQLRRVLATLLGPGNDFIIYICDIPASQQRALGSIARCAAACQGLRSAKLFEHCCK